VAPRRFLSGNLSALEVTLSTHVITMCNLDHLQVWIRTSQLLGVHVPAERYLLYVPEDQINIFSEVSQPGTTVLSQESLSASYRRELSESVSSAGMGHRFGWYLQQYNKIEALTRQDCDLVVIWDADCVPVRPQQLLTPDGLPTFMYADEYHPEYFAMIRRLLNIGRVQHQSFVIPAFPIRHQWIHDFVRDVSEKNDDLPWWEALIRSTDFSEVGAFSETETLGTWIANRYPDGWVSCDMPWERYGRSRFGDVRKYSASDLMQLGAKHDLGIISFENWDKRTMHWWARRAKANLRKVARRSGS
jgi:hypothetical protein